MNIEATNSRNTPTYLAHYDMRRAPFSTRVENDMYFADATLAQRLDLLLHLTQYGNELLLVTAQNGIGKTALLNQFIERAQSNWSVGSIVATDATQTEQFIKQIYRQFILRDESHSKTTNSRQLTSSHAKKHLEAYLHENRRVVLLVDDADKLSASVLELVLDLSTIIQDGKSSLQIILFCHPQIKIKLADPELEQKRFLKQRKIDLPSLNFAQTDQLIQHRLKQTGMSASKIFTHSAIKRIHKTSKGIPEDICQIAHQILTDSTPKVRHRFFNLDYILHPPIPRSMNALILALIAVILAAILFYQESINALYHNHSDTDAVIQTQINLNIPSASNFNEGLGLNSDTAVAARSKSLQPMQLSETSNGRLAVNSPQNSRRMASESSKQNLPAKNTTNTGVTNPRLAEPDTNNKPAEFIPNQTRNIPTAELNILLGEGELSIKRKSKWLLSQNSTSYTLQLLAGYNLSTIKNFLSKNTISAQNLAYYLSYNNGKQWHSLVYGIYPSRDTARLAIKTLPDTLIIDKPWIRQLHFIKKDINDTP